MRKTLEHTAICVTISLLFVLGALASQQVLEPTLGVALLTGALTPPSPAQLAWSDGPIFPPDPVDIPAALARLNDGPIFPPDPVDIPALARLNDGPIFPPDPVDIPKAGA